MSVKYENNANMAVKENTNVYKIATPVEGVSNHVIAGLWVQGTHAQDFVGSGPSTHPVENLPFRSVKNSDKFTNFFVTHSTN